MTRKTNTRSRFERGALGQLGEWHRNAWLAASLACLPIAGVLPASAAPPEAIAQQQLAEPRQLLERGKQFVASGEFESAAQVLQQALNRYPADATLETSQARNYLAIAYQELGQLDAARSAIAASIAQLDALPEREPPAELLLAQAWDRRGHLHFALSQLEAALADWQTAAEIYNRSGDRLGELGSELNQIQALHALGSTRNALKRLETLSGNWQSESDSALKVRALLSLGNLRRATGSTRRSRQLLAAAAELAEQLELPDETGQAYLSLGNTLRSLGDREKALSAFERAAAVAPSAIARVRALNNQLPLRGETEFLASLAPLVSQIRGELDKLPAGREAIAARINLASHLIELDAGRNEVVPLLSDAAEQAEAIGDEQNLSYALGTWGRLHERQGEWELAEVKTEQALFFAQGLQAPEIAYRWQWQLGRLYEARGEREPAIAAYSEAVEVLQGIRGELAAASSEVQYSFQQSVEPLYRRLVGLLLATDGNSSPTPANLQRARSLVEALRRAELDDFFDDDCLEAVPVAIDQLDPKTAVIYPIVLEDRLAVIASLGGQPLRYFETELPRTEIDRTLKAFLSSLTPYDVSRKSGEQIYDWLVRPLETELARAGIDTLAFVPDRGFREISLAALSNGQTFLIEKYNLVISPGLELLPPRASANRQETAVFAAGLSEERQGFPALPYVETELEAIAETLPQDRRLLNRTFTNANLIEAIENSRASILHLATHGQFGGRAEETFVLTWDERLDIEELQQLVEQRERQTGRILELLILSACSTAAGDDRAVLGLAGMAVRSGARSTLAGLWPLSDEAAAVFMTHFYNALAVPETTPAQATRTAQLALMRDPRFADPYFWAPFVLVGNWL